MNIKTTGMAVVIIVIVVVGGLIGVTLLSGDGQTTTTTDTTTTIEEDNGFIPIVEYIESTFDGTGFADVPGGNSTLESTYNALLLLDVLSLTNAAALKDEFNETAYALKATQSPTGYFGIWNESTLEKLIKTTYSVASLRIMDEYDEDTEYDVSTWLMRYYVGGIGFDEWLIEGVFEMKYWAIKVANAHTQYRHVMSFSKLSIESNVFDPGNDTGMTQIVLYTDEIHWTHGFTDQSLGRRLKYLETFEYMVYHKYERPTIINLLVNTTGTVDDIVALYNETSGLFNVTSLESSRLFRLLASVGGLGEVFTDSTIDGRLALLSQAVESVVEITPRECNPDSTVSEILGLTQSWLDVDLWTRS